MVWIVAKARDEHASAIEWLNKHTDDDLSFFLIEVHAYTIGDSAPAPMFKIVEQPNDFAKTVKSIAHKGELNETQTNRIQFWTQFNDVIEQRGKPFNKRKATPDHWYDVAIGSSQCHISIDLVNKEHRIRVGVWVPDNKELYDIFFEHKDEIEDIAGCHFVWDRLDGKKAAIICTYIPGLNYNKQDNYPELMNKIVDLVIVMRSAFTPFINKS